MTYSISVQQTEPAKPVLSCCPSSTPALPPSYLRKQTNDTDRPTGSRRSIDQCRSMQSKKPPISKSGTRTPRTPVVDMDTPKSPLFGTIHGHPESMVLGVFSLDSVMCIKHKQVYCCKVRNKSSGAKALVRSSLD